jgi:hypothetical protein
MISEIDSKIISVVVQGLSVGMEESDPKKRYTDRCLKSIRKYLPDAQIIFSTWQRCDTTGLECDEIIKGEEPEPIYMAFVDGRTKLMTVNNQIISTNNGLRVADREYVLKVRSDLELKGIGFIKYFLKYNGKSGGEFLKKRVVVLPTYNPRRRAKILFDPSDWMFFGLTEDIKNIFKVPEMKVDQLRGEKINGYYPIFENSEAEQYIWTSFLSKYITVNLRHPGDFSTELMEISEKSYARNLIMLPAQKANVKCLKMPNAGYGARPWLSQGLYTFNEYKKIYNIYNEKKVFYLPNPFESLAYYIAYNLRYFVMKNSPFIYRHLVNAVRRKNGSTNLLK